MTDVWLPDTKILINPLGQKIRNVPCIEDLSTLPLQMGPIRYRFDTKQMYVWPLTAVHQEVVDIFTVHKFMKANCKAAQLHQDLIQVIQQLVAILGFHMTSRGIHIWVSAIMEPLGSLI